MSSPLSILAESFAERGTFSIKYNNLEEVREREKKHIEKLNKNNYSSPFNPLQRINKLDKCKFDYGILGKTKKSTAVSKVPNRKISKTQKFSLQHYASNHEMSFSERVSKNTQFLSGIIDNLIDPPYEMSDWSDEEPMKSIDPDLLADEVNGKPIPSWATEKELSIAMKTQRSADGDLIFKSLLRRVDYFSLFGTKEIPYYCRRK